MPDYAAHEAVYFSQAITADDFAMKKNPKYVNKVVAPTLEPISSIGGFRTLPDYSFDTMPDDYVALVLIGGFGWNTPVAEKVMPIIKSAIEQEKVIGAICNAASFMAKCGIDRETTSKTLQKSSVIQKISVTLSSVIIAIIVCKLLIFNTLRLCLPAHYALWFFCGVCFCCNFASLYIVAAAALCLWTFGIDFAFAVYC